MRLVEIYSLLLLTELVIRVSKGFPFNRNYQFFSISRNEREFDTNATVTGQFEH